MSGILVTSPMPRGERLCEKIRLAGGTPIYFPTIEIVPIRMQEKFTEPFNWLIFTSPNAVKYRPTVLKYSHIAAIGGATAAALRQANLPVTLYPEEDWSSEGLLALTPFQDVTHKKIAIIKGVGGRELLASVLTDRGAMVTPILVYQRCLPKIDSSKTIHFDIIVCTSNESLENLLKVGWEVIHHPLVVVSERAAAYAKNIGFNKIIIAKNASDESIIETLKGLSYGTKCSSK